MKDHLLAIRNLADRDRKEELITYVDSILDDIGSAAPPYRTGNDTADVIIADKKAKADKRGFDLRVSGDIAGVDIDTSDIVTILSNLLDNAIEALCRLYGSELTAEQKMIELEFRKNSNFLFIVEKNISNSKIGDGMIRSSKNSPDHGFGVYSIRRAVKKYGGEFNINCDRIGDQDLYTVEVEIILPMKAG
jgi:sensor histidine kinase regulating citrate/malate metabolism